MTSTPGAAGPTAVPLKQTERPHPLTPLVRGWLILVALAIGWGREFVTSASGDQLEPGGLGWFLAVLAVVVLLAAIAAGHLPAL